jgi:hypothetical protein
VWSLPTFRTFLNCAQCHWELSDLDLHFLDWTFLNVKDHVESLIEAREFNHILSDRSICVFDHEQFKTNLIAFFLEQARLSYKQ